MPPNGLIPFVERLAEPGDPPKERTLTNLYNSFPEWLRDAHNGLDEAVLRRIRMAVPSSRRRRHQSAARL